MAENVVDLEYILLSREAYQAYSQLAQRVALALRELNIDPVRIPDEQGRVNEDGSLDIFVTLPDDKGEVSMNVPKGQWAWRSVQ